MQESPPKMGARHRPPVPLHWAVVKRVRGLQGRKTEAARLEAERATRLALAWLDVVGRSHRAWVWGLVALYTTVFTGLCANKFRFYLYTDFDLAIFAQAVDRLLHGSTWNSVRGMNWLGDHSSLLLFLVTPLYAVFRHPLALLALQSAALGAGAFAVHRLAVRKLHDEATGVLFAGLYLLYPAVGYTNLFEFHPETLSTPLLLFAFDALIAGRLTSLLTFTGLALLAKEDVALGVLGMGLFSLTIRRPRRWVFAAALAGLALVSLTITFAWLKPTFSHGQADYGRMFAAWGTTPARVAANVLQHPWAAVSSLFATPGDPQDSLLKREYFLHMLLPLMGLPLLAPLALFGALPVLMQHFLSSRPAQHAIVNQYTALVSPFFVGAAVLGTANLLGLMRVRGQHKRMAARSIALVTLMASLGANLLFGPLLGHGVLQAMGPRERFWPSARDRDLKPYRDRMAARIPHEAGIVTSYEYLPRFVDRANLQSFQHLFTGQYTYSEKPYPPPTGIDAMLTALGDQYTPGAAARVRDLLRREDLHPVDAADDLTLWLRGARDTIDLVTIGDFAANASKGIVYDGQLTFLGCDFDTARAGRVGTLTLHTYWRRRSTIDHVYLTRLWLYDDQENEVLYRTRYLGYATETADRWPLGQTVRETYRLGLPGSLPAGAIRLVMQVTHVPPPRGEMASADDPSLMRYEGLLLLGTFRSMR